MNEIGTHRETTLHATLKKHYAIGEADVEYLLGGYIVDVKRVDELVEIQTGNFGGIRKKLAALLASNKVRLVYPMAKRRTVVRIDSGGGEISRRKSPKKAAITDLFDELVYIPGLALDPNFTLEVVFVEEAVYWQDDGKGSWRRKGWSIADRRVEKILDKVVFSSAADYARLLPDGLAETFTVRQLAKTGGLQLRLAYKMVYTLERMGILQRAGKSGRSRLYQNALVIQ